MNFDKLTYWLAAVFSFALLVLPKIFPVCEVGAKPMRCFYAYQADFLVALLAFVAALSLFFAKQAETKRLTGFFLLLIGIIIIILPTQAVIGICGHADSPCHITTAVTASASGVLAIVGTVIAWRKQGEDKAQ